MHIIKLNATDSTNSYLKDIWNTSLVEDYTVVTANYQTKGHGQMGTHWQSEASKNLMCSVFKDSSEILIADQFYISIVTSLAIIKALEKLQIPKLNIKWPNDILSDQKKVCGILIENVIKTNFLEASIIGIGLNVNQTEFKNLPQASSLKSITGKVYVIDEVLQYIMNYLKYYQNYLNRRDLKFLKTEYERYLFRKDKPSTFKDTNGLAFSGFIKGIEKSGKLKVKLEDDVLVHYGFKEIELLY